MNVLVSEAVLVYKPDIVVHLYVQFMKQLLVLIVLQMARGISDNRLADLKQALRATHSLCPGRTLSVR